MNENVNIDENVDENMNENVNADDENVNTDDENVNADDEYEQDDVEDEEVIGNDREDFIVDEEHVIDEVEVNMQGFTFSVQEQGDDTASITRRSLRKLRKIGGQSCVETRRKNEIVKNDSERLQAKCKGNVVESGNSVSQGNNKLKGKSVNLVDEDKRECPWKVYISVGDNLEWVVRTLKNDHLCQQSREIRAWTSTFLSQHVVDLLHTNPQIPIKAVQEHMQ
ncbi:hypothetical protein Tco_0148060, partial [Tanacetum coccineum]